MNDDSNAPPPPSLQDFQRRNDRNPFGGDVTVVQPIGALANAEMHRSIAEVQARMIIARSNPRDPQRCMDLILLDCTRPTLADSALYEYSRGGTDISGPSIRLAESVARRWGNIASGIKELSRGNGYSECVAYAWDLETGYYDERQFQIKHWRDTKKGGYVLTDERDIYELIANLGQRRKRAVLLTVIPGDVVEAAVQQCEETLRADVDLSPEALKKLATAFAAHGVTQAQIEKRCQRKLEAIRPAQVVQLRKIYASLRDEMSEPKDWFETNAWTEVAERHAEDARQQQAPVDQSTSQQKPKTASKRQQAPAKEKPQETNEVPAAHNAPTEEVVAAAAPSPEEVPAASSGDAAPSFEEWLLDENGEPIGDEPFSDPMLFVGRLEVIWQLSPETRERLMQENTQGLEAAAAISEKAAGIIESMRSAAPVEQAATAEHVATVVPFTTAAQYLREFRPAVASLPAEDYLDFIAANQATMLTTPMSTRSLLVKALVEQADRLGIGRPAGLAEMMQDKPKATEPAQQPVSSPPAPAEDPEMARDTKGVNDRISEMQACKTSHELTSMGTGVIMRWFGERLVREGKSELKQRLDDAYRARAAQLNG